MKSRILFDTRAEFDAGLFGLDSPADPYITSDGLIVELFDNSTVSVLTGEASIDLADLIQVKCLRDALDTAVTILERRGVK